MPDATNKPKGRLFSRLYIARQEDKKDSARWRRRLYEAFLNAASDSEKTELAKIIRARLGIDYPRAHYGYDHEEYWTEASLHDVLDGITLATSLWSHSPQKKQYWLQVIESIFRDEGMGYTVDEAGGVHPHVDVEFQRSKAIVLRKLEASGQKVIEELVNRALEGIDGRSQNHKNALRDIHEAVETLVKGITGESRLDGVAIRKLGDRFVTSLGADERAANYTRAMCRSLEDWANAFHEYRHGKSSDAALDPPEHIAVQGVSTGLAWIRWILDSY